MICKNVAVLKYKHGGLADLEKLLQLKRATGLARVLIKDVSLTPQPHGAETFLSS
jgi:hypothetical protein